jgi:hypothetical protein
MRNWTGLSGSLGSVARCCSKREFPIDRISYVRDFANLRSLFPVKF